MPDADRGSATSDVRRRAGLVAPCGMGGACSVRSAGQGRNFGVISARPVLRAGLGALAAALLLASVAGCGGSGGRPLRGCSRRVPRCRPRRPAPRRRRRRSLPRIPRCAVAGSTVELKRSKVPLGGCQGETQRSVPAQEIHVVLDNLSTRTAAYDLVRTKAGAFQRIGVENRRCQMLVCRGHDGVV